MQSGGTRRVPRRVAVVGLVVLFLAAPACGSGEANESTSTSRAPAALALEAAGTSGTDPFTESVAIDETALAADASLALTTTQTGDTPGLYGGTQDEQACDADGLVSFLEQDPDKATAWAGALDLQPAGIADYVVTLTPVVLRVDTRVTNHGYTNRAATPRQSVLQAGTAVLVDIYGIPRVRCSCGNPLTEPTPTDPATLTGDPWTGWNPAQLVTVTGTVQINQFELWDLTNGGTYSVQIGGTPVTTTTTQPPTTLPPTTITVPPSTTSTIDPTLNPCPNCSTDEWEAPRVFQ